MRWRCTICLKLSWKERDRTASVKRFHTRQKRRTNTLRCPVTLDFGSSVTQEGVTGRMHIHPGFDGEYRRTGSRGSYKIMADSETQKLERQNIFKRIVEKVNGDWGGG